MNWKLITLILLCSSFTTFAQKQQVDSLENRLSVEKNDSIKVNLMCDIGFALRTNEPEKALKIANEALLLAKNIKYIDGQSRSLGTIAIIFRLLGNFPLALEYNLKRLKLVENSRDQEKLGGVLGNIAVVYANQEQYKNALVYYYRADSIINHLKNIDSTKYIIALNIGDAYDKLNVNDSAFSYFNKSLNIARQVKSNYYEGMAMVGLGNSYLKTNQYLLSMANYKSGIIYLKEAEDDDLLCEAYLGLANLFKKLNKKDSALFYSRQSFALAKKDGFLPRHLEAAQFLTEHFKNEKNIDSSFLYLNYVQDLNDSINSKSRIRESQVLSSNEQARQLEIAENLATAKKERKQQLQMLFIAIFIPGFFILTLLLSKIKLHVRFIKISGVLSLLILFEYLTLLLHPYVSKITHHTPIYEMLIFVSFAAILIPTHHRLEHWLMHWLTKNRPTTAGDKLTLKKVKIIKKIT